MPDGKIIKADQLSRSVRAAPYRVVRHDIDVARLRAGEMMQAAQQQVTEMVAQAQAQLAAVVQAHATRGYEEGLKLWNEILFNSTAKSEEIARRYEADLLKLAVRMAEKIVGDRLAADPATMIGIVGEALKSVRREKSLTIQVSPDSVELVRNNVEELKKRVGGTKEIWVEANTDVTPGGCIVISDVGVIDAQLETQLRCMEQVLLQAAKK